MINIRRTISRSLAAVAIAFAAVAGISSCNAIKDELPPCPEGVKLRFVFDYNMEFANAFPRRSIASHSSSMTRPATLLPSAPKHPLCSPTKTGA